MSEEAERVEHQETGGQAGAYQAVPDPLDTDHPPSQPIVILLSAADDWVSVQVMQSLLHTGSHCRPPQGSRQAQDWEKRKLVNSNWMHYDFYRYYAGSSAYSYYAVIQYCMLDYMVQTMLSFICSTHFPAWSHTTQNYSYVSTNLTSPTFWHILLLQSLYSLESLDIQLRRVNSSTDFCTTTLRNQLSIWVLWCWLKTVYYILYNFMQFCSSLHQKRLTISELL